MKAGLFGGGWEDYLDALNEALTGMWPRMRRRIRLRRVSMRY